MCFCKLPLFLKYRFGVTYIFAMKVTHAFAKRAISPDPNFIEVWNIIEKANFPIATYVFVMNFILCFHVTSDIERRLAAGTEVFAPGDLLAIFEEYDDPTVKSIYFRHRFV